MRHVHWSRMSVAVGTIVFLSACSDASAPPIRTFSTPPVAAYTGGPDLSDYNDFPGELWACPDVPYPVIGFIYRWSIVDQATNQVVQSGVSTNLTAGICVLLASVSTTIPGHYTAFVREDPSGPFKISSITANYGANLPIPPPTATIDTNGKRISDTITNDYGVVFIFYH